MTTTPPTTPAVAAPTAPSTAAPADARSVLSAMYAAETRYLAAGGPGRASFAPLAPHFAPDVVLHQADGLPYGGTWRGHEGLERFFLAMADTWAEFDIVRQEFLAEGGTGARRTVCVHSDIRARARATGRAIAFPILQAITVEEGRIREVRPFYWDTAAIAAACR
ncbi:nuclear transport factor 2 family protein [Streptomyces sp. AN091965]|uniref:nuclear transport factor 2 family protein n=1 Tax=Streptomyces sp. AN091965 TaxID=2927803 RepID=UPI001F60EFC8|nr:nuclear transport factor 2 family protein [Streptomyces sp. AN091965]MCI3933176.1 nuclear transport factor 2 family protein [Streptomyces sp. AN091965]